MPYDINNYSPTYGGVINSSGNVVNVADSLDETTGQFKPPANKTFVFQLNAVALGTGTPATITGFNSLLVTCTSTGSAVITFEYSTDNTNWFALAGQQANTTTSSLALQSTLTATSTHSIRFSTQGFDYVRCRITTYTSGTINVYGEASTAVFTPLQGAMSPFGSVDTNGTSNTLLGVGSHNLIYDGTNFARQRGMQAVADGSTGVGVAASGLVAYNGSTYDRVRTSEAIADATAGKFLAVGLWGYNGATFDRVRVPNVYKYIGFASLAATTGVAAWTPTAGKKFRLMGCTLQTSVSAAILLKDGAGGTIFQLFYPNANEAFYINLENGYLSTAANNVMEVYNSGATAATIRLSFFGTEE